MVRGGDRATLYEGGGIEGGDIEGGSKCCSSRLEVCGTTFGEGAAIEEAGWKWWRGNCSGGQRQAVTAQHHERKSLVAERKSQRCSAEPGAAERYGNRTGEDAAEWTRIE